MKVVIILSVLALAACGANGAPERPTMNAGVTISPSGVDTSVSVGTHVGPVWLSIGL